MVEFMWYVFRLKLVEADEEMFENIEFQWNKLAEERKYVLK